MAVLNQVNTFDRATTTLPQPNTGLDPDEVLAALNAPGKPQARDLGLGQEDFMRLLTTQLQNQDPTDPMDPKDMITDLTGFNQLEAMLKLNASVENMVQGFASLQTMQAASLIGKSVKVAAQEVEYQPGLTPQIRLTSDQPLQDVRLVISDGNGPVKEIAVGTLNADRLAEWDGTDESGNPVPAGTYKLTAYGTDANGEIQSVTTIVPTRVTSVAVEPSGASLKLSLATGEVVDLDSVREISE
ncbi:flagellar hook capping FlgD N-terminal domain-containing protein [Sulfurivirga sp.]|uniref:flagellar hook assembly protein FlgD n=1 Tax=Sulfurivirga sp. TaxID=2614236 RepID=UPI0025FE5CF8|nr:flagellar hook capping FlgD N-terminal domain-containing protein [Sulfurivirga sp.]